MPPAMFLTEVYPAFIAGKLTGNLREKSEDRTTIEGNSIIFDRDF